MAANKLQIRVLVNLLMFTDVSVESNRNCAAGAIYTPALSYECAGKTFLPNNSTNRGACGGANGTNAVALARTPGKGYNPH